MTSPPHRVRLSKRIKSNKFVWIRNANANAKKKLIIRRASHILCALCLFSVRLPWFLWIHITCMYLWLNCLLYLFSIQFDGLCVEMMITLYNFCRGRCCCIYRSRLNMYACKECSGESWFAAKQTIHLGINVQQSGVLNKIEYNNRYRHKWKRVCWWTFRKIKEKKNEKIEQHSRQINFYRKIRGKWTMKRKQKHFSWIK